MDQIPKAEGVYILLRDNEKQKVKWEVDYGVYRLAAEECLLLILRWEEGLPY